jgi:hypothetical protein
MAPLEAQRLAAVPIPDGITARAGTHHGDPSRAMSRPMKRNVNTANGSASSEPNLGLGLEGAGVKPLDYCHLKSLIVGLGDIPSIVLSITQSPTFTGKLPLMRSDQISSLHLRGIYNTVDASAGNPIGFYATGIVVLYLMTRLALMGLQPLKPERIPKPL